MAEESEVRKETVVAKEGEAPTVHKERTVAKSGPEPTRSWRANSIIYYILGLIEVLLGLRLILRLSGANPGSGFVDLIEAVTDPLVAPFAGIFRVAREDGSVLEPATLVAMVVYGLVAYGIVALLRISTARRPEEVEGP